MFPLKRSLLLHLWRKKCPSSLRDKLSHTCRPYWPPPAKFRLLITVSLINKTVRHNECYQEYQVWFHKHLRLDLRYANCVSYTWQKVFVFLSHYLTRESPLRLQLAGNLDGKHRKYMKMSKNYDSLSVSSLKKRYQLSWTSLLCLTPRFLC